MYRAVNRKKKPPITSTKHVINSEYCKLRNSTAGSTVRFDDTLEESDCELLVMAEYEKSDDANTGFSASET
jgi:hypothetical protein